MKARDLQIKETTNNKQPVAGERELLERGNRWREGTAGGRKNRRYYNAVQRKTAVAAYLKSKQLLLFTFARYHCTTG